MRHHLSGHLTRHLAIVLAMISGASGTSCSITALTFHSSTNVGGAAPVQRLLVFADLRDSASGMYRSFDRHFTRMLAMCGVESRVLLKPSRGFDEDGLVSLTLEKLRPDTVLSISTVDTIIIPGKRSRNWWQLELQILDRESQDVSWHARATLKDVGLPFDDSFGEDFAAGIITRLRADGVLKNCPSWGFTRSACLEERNRRLFAAKRVRDERRRKAIIDAAPTCQE